MIGMVDFYTSLRHPALSTWSRFDPQLHFPELGPLKPGFVTRDF